MKLLLILLVSLLAVAVLSAEQEASKTRAPRRFKLALTEEQKAKITERKEAHNKKRKERLEKLSPEAKELVAKLEAIFKKKGGSIAEKKKEADALVKAAPESVRKEIQPKRTRGHRHAKRTTVKA